jgi:hypothetical protein
MLFLIIKPLTILILLNVALLRGIIVIELSYPTLCQYYLT